VAGISKQSRTSHENIEVVKRFYRLWEAADFDPMAELFDPQVAAYAPEGWPEPGPWHGREAVLRQVRAVRREFGDQRFVIEEIAAHGDWVATRHRTFARGNRSGLEAEFRNSVAFRLGAGKIVEARFYWDHAQALQAAGLQA
jgi:ketosteroid isomerase-like protein